MTEKTQALMWAGGKSFWNKNGVGQWVTSLLKPEIEVPCYVELFAGMLGVMLQRDAVLVEVANDIDDCVVNFFQVVRDDRQEFLERLASMPFYATWNRQWCFSHLHDGTPVERALAFTISVINGRINYKGHWRNHYKVVNYGRLKARKETILERFEVLSERIANVVFESQDALFLLDEYSNTSDAMIYLDPPYPSLDKHQIYRHTTLDTDAYVEVLRDHKAFIAISGYADEWNALGWQRHEKDCISYMNPDMGSRTEVLWTNYEPEVDSLFD